MKTTAVLTYRMKGSKDVRIDRYNISDDMGLVAYEANVEALRAIKDDEGNYIQESMVDYMVTSFEMN
jgi:hypothetical protein